MCLRGLIRILLVGLFVICAGTESAQCGASPDHLETTDAHDAIDADTSVIFTGQDLTPEVYPFPIDSERPLAWWNVLILVNQDSPAGLEIVKMYRQFHPEIRDNQVVYLAGLTDSASLSAGPADEILTRNEFETLIAQPTRDHLVNWGIVDRTYVIITTAGMPYRIEDTDLALGDVVMPAASDAGLSVDNRHAVNAASIESELSVLFQIDPTLPEGTRAPINGRLVNPYQGYRSSIKKWALDRDVFNRRTQFRWANMWRIFKSPMLEGEFNSAGYSVLDRRMSPADIYLVARLDGPRLVGEYPVHAVYEMLLRSVMVNDSGHSEFVGLSQSDSVIAFDHSPSPPAPGVFAFTQIYNMPPVFPELDYETHPIPPGGEDYSGTFSVGNHFFRAHEWVTGSPATAGVTGMASVSLTLGGISFWDDTATILNSGLLLETQAIIALQSYGRNGGDGRPANYLLKSGPDEGPLFSCAPGAVFSSLESFNAVTMFLDPSTSQGKICEFIEMGGTAAVGHSFEPESGAIIQSEFLISNYLRDENLDGDADLTIIEAVYSSMPYLSWSEVFIGDPLTRLKTGPGGRIDIVPRLGDANRDYYVGFADVLLVLGHFDSMFGEQGYFVRADLNEDGLVDGADLAIVLDNYNTEYPTPE
ncbi:MAG: hypothetical protein DHS20C16_09440 [Phycisphaerae bacterium]|nr:MAG: hypothetical protein DHS20C16_09440 [Phycisphaerae bacterium]